MTGDAVAPGRNPTYGADTVGRWDWDVVADRVTADPAFARLYGVDPQKAAHGAPIAEFFAGIYPDDLPGVQALIAETLRTAGSFESEYRLMQEDGRPRWVAAQGRVVTAEDGTPLRFPGITYDVDTRKTGELRLAALLRLNDRFRDLKDPAEIAYTAAEILARTLDVSRAGYGTIDPEQETITVERDWNAPGVTTLAGTLQFRDYGSYIEDLKRGDTAVVEDAYADPRTRDTADALVGISARSFINMPITEEGGFVALLYLNHATQRHWTPEELAFVREVAERTRDAVERRRAEAELAALNAQLESQVEERTRELLVAEEHLRQAQKMEAVEAIDRRSRARFQQPADRDQRCDRDDAGAHPAGADRRTRSLCLGGTRRGQAGGGADPPPARLFAAADARSAPDRRQ